MQQLRIINEQRFWEDIEEGDNLQRIEMEVPFRKVILNAATTWDYFPGHHNPEYARGQGQKTIYINTIFFQGFIDRVITDWAGPGTFMIKRKMSMKGSIYAGDTMHGEGRVIRKYIDNNRHLIDLQISIGNQDGPCCPATATVCLPVKRPFNNTGS